MNRTVPFSTVHLRLPYGQSQETTVRFSLGSNWKMEKRLLVRLRHKRRQKDASQRKTDGRSAGLRVAILKAGRTAYLKEGYSHTSMSQIAARAGISKATLYNHFPSKEELFIAVCEEESTQALAPLFDVGEMQGDVREVLENFVQRTLTLMLSDDLQAFYRLVVAEAARFPEIGRTAYEFGIRRGLERMTRYLTAAIERGELRRMNVWVAADQFLDLCAGNLHRQKLWGIVRSISRHEIEIHAKRAVATFLAAYGNDELCRAAREYVSL
jgi:TetR/AcrR family transcriptional regulator, mexJK operon transcriptional repressor